jgi:lipoate-protein ligase A
MVVKNEKVPTFEEFIDALREALQERAKERNDISDETIEDWLVDDEEWLKYDYEDNLRKYEKGETTIDSFLTSRVNATAYNMYMEYF